MTSRSRSRLLSTSLVAGLALATGAAAGCAHRTAAATQPTPAAFDAGKSDPKAIAVADATIAAMGGAAAWDKAHEIQWHEQIMVDGKPILDANHAWDRWNGRHRFEKVDQAGARGVVMHELFSDTTYAEIDAPKGKAAPVMKKEKETMTAEANKRFLEDSYLLVMPFKLKDPGVHLAYAEERPDPDDKAEKPAMKFDSIKVTFDPGIGPHPGNVYYVVVAKDTHLVDRIELVEEGKADNQRIGYKWDKWVDAGGLKFATIRQNIGRPGEQVIFSEIKVEAAPEDDLYVPRVTDG